MPPSKPPSDPAASRLVALAERVYGEQWRASLERDTGANASTVYRWISGRSDIPRSVFLSLAWSASDGPREAMTDAELEAAIDRVLGIERRKR